MQHMLLTDILLLLATTVVFIVVCKRLRLPAVLAYLFVGIAVGPAALGWFANSEHINILGEIGIAFLLFSIGLQFSFTQFMALRDVLMKLGALQVLVGSVSGALIAWWIGIPPGPAIVVGGALAMSSTAIVVKQLTDQAEIQARHGRLALGTLLFQDLAAIPFMVIIPVLAADGQASGTMLLLALAKGVVAVICVLALGRWALRPLFFEVARAHSAELFTLTVLFVSLLAAWITALLGLSLVLGAFLAGMMLSETEYRHQIDSELRPFKDILLGLFFVTVGMQLDLSTLPAVWHWVILLVLGMVIGKAGLVSLLVWWLERDKMLAARTGLVLAHGGEFGLVLLSLALVNDVLDFDNSQPVLTAIVASMVIATLLVRHNERLTRFLLKEPAATANHGETQAREIAAAMQDQAEHVVICGFGRVGSQLARLLRSQAIPYVALDLHPQVVKTAWEQGDRVYYGDASHPEVLKAIGLQRASALVISFEHESTTLKTMHHAQRLAAAVPILVRSQDERNADSLLNAGATQVFADTLQTSLMLAVNLMIRFNMSDAKINACVRSHGLRDASSVATSR